MLTTQDAQYIPSMPRRAVATGASTPAERSASMRSPASTTSGSYTTVTRPLVPLTAALSTPDRLFSPDSMRPASAEVMPGSGSSISRAPGVSETPVVEDIVPGT